VVGWVFATLLGVAGLLPQTALTPANAESLPSVSILLPADILSETVQISYFLVGPFGGYGGYATQLAGVHAYEIPAVVEGKAATEIRMIVYASGCEIQTFVIPLANESRINQKFACQHAAMVKLSGQITPSELVRDHNAELVVSYMAHWAHPFYGIADGSVTEFRLATISPDANGAFQVDLPYFSAAGAASSSQASFRLMLRDSKTWNHIASNLEPDIPELMFEEHCLRIQAHYPEGLKFTPSRANSSGVEGKVFRSDSNEAISNSYILLENAWGEHFDVRTNGQGEYLFESTPPGNYTASISAWFPKKGDVPCQTALGSTTVDGGKVTVEWQRKSGAFMEVVTIKEFSVDSGQHTFKDIDLYCR
jgi:hypothetical protein